MGERGNGTISRADHDGEYSFGNLRYKSFIGRCNRRHTAQTEKTHLLLKRQAEDIGHHLIWQAAVGDGLQNLRPVPQRGAAYG